ncbi:cupin domain-containing protein [Elizabethkingia anophelis]|uniref:cupin domain-containing protein n=1 Tax=Elizabethkingia anophelis TaxID=1117645 RepID=UPI003891C055
MKINNINVSLSTTEDYQNDIVKLVHLTGDKNISVFLIELDPGQFIPAHYHKIGIETYFILSGEGTIYLGHIINNKLIWNQKTKVIDGDYFSIVPNQVHRFENNSDKKIRLIATAPLTHATDEDRFFV